MALFGKLFKNQKSKSVDNEDGFFIDKRDGKKYKTIEIGNQIWMGKDLSFMCENGECTKGKYGNLYTLESAKKACPKGWHIPSFKEWSTLIDYLSNQGYGNEIGIALKSTKDWKHEGEKGNGEDIFDFSAFPTGFPDNSVLSNPGAAGAWWSSTYDGGEVKGLLLTALHPFHNFFTAPSNVELSVRCIKD